MGHPHGLEYGDFQDLAGSYGRRTEAPIRNVEVAVRSKGHRCRQQQLHRADAEANLLRRDFAPADDLHDLRRAIFDGKRVEVADEEVVAIVGEGGRNDVSLHPGDVSDSPDVSAS
jgi:hypothetical protein